MATPFLQKLAHDVRGNTLAIFAVALVPVTMMVGSGLDIGITYMARAKLQNACDAAVLGARQGMSGNAWTTQDETEGKKFFNFNFPASTHDVTELNFTVAPDATDPSKIVGSASANVPTSLMNMFGFESLPITAKCDAKRDLGHNDVLLVLDVTGSMNQVPSTGGSVSKISRLRTGAKGLYDALEDSINGSVTRYGFVPYSHTVNVARSLRTDDILRNVTYVRRYIEDYDYTQCEVDRNNRLRNCIARVSVNYPEAGWVRNEYNEWRYNINISANYVTSTKNVHIDDTRWGSSSNSNTNIDAFRTGGDGCIEERRSVGESSYEMTGTVTRADIDTAFSGTDYALRFGRYDPDAQEAERQVGCPSEAKKLATYADKAAFNKAVQDVTGEVTGGTYHDVGILWGARFLSQTGFFASDNPSDILGIPVNKHIVFMTDGVIDTDKADGSNDLYSAHSLERFLDRTKGGNTANVEDHKDRFLSACSVAKSMGITIWVIALDVTNSDDIKPCATSNGHFFESDGTDLEDKFATIGQGIGNLRLTR